MWYHMWYDLGGGRLALALVAAAMVLRLQLRQPRRRQRTGAMDWPGPKWSWFPDWTCCNSCCAHSEWRLICSHWRRWVNLRSPCMHSAQHGHSVQAWSLDWGGCQSVRCVAGGGRIATSCTTAPVYAGAQLEATLEGLKCVQIIGFFARSHYIAEAFIGGPT